MTQQLKDILEAASKLSPEERAELVEELLAGLGEAPQAIEEEWIDEALRRRDAYRRGDVKGVGFEEVMKKYQR